MSIDHQKNNTPENPKITLETLYEHVDIEKLSELDKKHLMIMLVVMNRVLASGNPDTAEDIYDILNIAIKSSGITDMPWWYDVLVSEFKQLISTLRATKITQENSQGDAIPKLQQDVLERIPV